VSGLALVWHRTGAPVRRATLERMQDRLAAPAGAAVAAWCEGPVALAHRRRPATPEAAVETLPLVSDTGEIVVTADARLDNRAALVAALGLSGRAAQELGDGALVLRAWARWGEECPDRLLGDFAFAVWDARRRVVFCARDPAGVKPFYYHLAPGVFAAASDTAVLLALPDVPRRLDEVRLAACLVPGLDDRRRTSFEGVLRLPPGHCLALGATGSPTPRAYWRPDPARVAPPGSDAEHAEAFRALFTDAVRCRLRGATSPAAALSGGLDSSSVVCVARALRNGAAEPLRTYTARFPTIPRCDEAAYVAAVEAQGGLVPRHVPADTLDPLGDFEARPGREDETFHLPAYYMHGALYQAARADGARVFLEGTGGDLVLSHGAGALQDLARRGHWLALARELGQLARAFERSPWPMLRGVASGLAPAAAVRAWRRLQRRGLIRPPPIRPEFARRIDLDGRLRATAPPPRGAGVEASRHEHARQLSSPRLAAVLEMVAALASEAGVEVRDPFLDRRVMELCVALPASQKLRHGRTRVVARHALATVLPAAIRDRPGKAVLELMFPAALTVYGAGRLAALMEEAAGVLGPYVPPEYVRRCYRRYCERGTPGLAGQVWRLGMLTLWLRRAAL
jgi:asparagine synthase (glutamine-hydrolysing)